MDNKKFYHQTWFFWLMLIFITPIGVILMWTQKRFKLIGRIALSVLFSLFFLIFITSFGEEKKPIAQRDVIQPNVSDNSSRVKNNQSEVISNNKDVTDNLPSATQSGTPQGQNTVKLTVKDLNKTFVDVINKYTKDSLIDIQDNKVNLYTDFSDDTIAKLIPELDGLYKKISKNSSDALFLEVDSKDEKGRDDIQKNSAFLAESISDFKDAITTIQNIKSNGGELLFTQNDKSSYYNVQFDNAKKELEKVLPFYKVINKSNSLK